MAGIREKILAAGRAGVKTVILPEKNKVDVEDLPEEIHKGLRVVLIDTIEEAAGSVLR